MLRDVILVFILIASSLFGKIIESSKSSEDLISLFNETQKDPSNQKRSTPYLKVIQSNTEKRSTLVYRCRYVSCISITHSVGSATSATGTVEVSKEQNLITVNDINSKIKEITALILSLDIESPQVLVEALVIEVRMSDGMEWDAGFKISDDNQSSFGTLLGGTSGFPGTAGNYPTSSGTWFDLFNTPNEWFAINSRLRWLQSNNKAKILSSPYIFVSLGESATVSTGTDLPLLNVSVNNGVSQESVYYKRTGVKLRVTPVLINQDTITLQVQPEVTSFVSSSKLSETTEAPIISVRNIDTKLNVTDGGVVIMGGLHSREHINDQEKTPYLSKIPLLGNIFKGHSKKVEKVQLIFILKVSIRSDTTVNLFRNLNTTQSQMEEAGEILEESILSNPSKARKK